MYLNKFLLPFEWKTEGEKNLLFCGDNKIGSYRRTNGDWSMNSLLFSKTLPYYPASESDIKLWVESTCMNELTSMQIDLDSYIQNIKDSATSSLLNKVKYGIRLIHNGTSQIPGELKKAYVANSDDLESRDAVGSYDEKLFKKIDEFLASLENRQGGQY